MIRLAVSIEYRRVTDRQTDGRTSCDSIVRAMHTVAHRAVKAMLVVGYTEL